MQVHLRRTPTLLPPALNLKQAVAFRQIRDLGSNRIPRDVARAAHRGKIGGYMVPIGAVRRCLWRSDSRQSGRIEKNDAFVRDLQFDGSLGSNHFWERDDRFRKRT